MRLPANCEKNFAQEFHHSSQCLQKKKTKSNLNSINRDSLTKLWYLRTVKYM